MEIIPPYLRIYQQILKDLENALPFLNVPKAKAGMRLGHLGKGREGVYGLGSLWRVVWCMEIGVIGVVKV